MKRQIKRIIKSMVIYIITFISIFICLNMMNEMNFENIRDSVLFIIILLSSTFFMLFYPMISITSFIVTTIKYKQDPYFRTQKGNELNKNLEGLKKFLREYSLLNKREKDEIAIWEDYLVYSVLFNQNKKVLEEYKKYII